jgi:hypothetical protein
MTGPSSYTNPLMLSDLLEAFRRETGQFAVSKPERISGFVNQTRADAKAVVNGSVGRGSIDGGRGKTGG